VEQQQQQQQQGEVWVFGYGSLMFRPDFPHVERRAGHVTGWSRRFWQASIDHRGTPDAPGRVVTLVATPGAVCWGVAFRVAAEHRAEVLARLDHRESGGYRRQTMALFTAAGVLDDVIVYVADETNPHYVGNEDEREIAAIVDAAIGPSGANRDYVLQLSAALAQLGTEDAHVSQIVAALSVLLGDNEV